jgi:hypothetical protein
MGVNLISVGCSFNWWSWRVLYDLGVTFGWKPAGTLPMIGGYDTGRWKYPPDDDPGPRDGYFNNDFQWVTEIDAAAWCVALHRALDALEGKAPMAPDQAEMVRKIRDDDGSTSPITAAMQAVAAAIDKDPAPFDGFDSASDEDRAPLTRQPLSVEVVTDSDLEGLIRRFVDKVASCRGFAIG